MDINGSIGYNGLTASAPAGAAGGAPYTGYVVNEVDFSGIDVVQYLDKRAIQEGVDAADIYLGGRHGRVIMGVYGSSEGHSFDQLSAALAAFDPILAYNADSAAIGFLPLTYLRPTADISTWPTSTYPGGIPLQMYVRPMRPPRYVIVREQTGGIVTLGFSIRLDIDMLAKDPRQYLQSQQAVSISTSTATATYRGNFPTWPIVQFTMSAAGDSAMVFAVAGGLLTINLSTITSGTYTINYSDRDIKDADGALANSLFVTSATQDFRQVKVGSTYYASAATGISAMTLTYREAFV